MNKYMSLDLESLIDMLIARIKEYDRMLSTRVFREEEFSQCKHILAQLHAAIKEKAKLEGYNTDNIFPNYPDWKARAQTSRNLAPVTKGKQRMGKKN